MASSRAKTGSSSLQERERPRLIDVMFLCGEWKSSTFHREFAINLAAATTGGMKIHCYVSKGDDHDREDAILHGVNLITARSLPGSVDPIDCLKIPPSELPNPHLVIGYGRKFGGAAFFLMQATNCKWIQFVHDHWEDLGNYKRTKLVATDTIEQNEKHKIEIELCKAADAVVAVGSRLQQKYSRSIPNVNVEVITPGIFEKFSVESRLARHKSVVRNFNVFLFDRATFKDLSLSGYDIVANAIGSLGKRFELTFVGSSAGEHQKVERWFLNNTCISRNQLIIRGYCGDPEELKMMFYQSNLVALPSRTEGFGLLPLIAISAGIPILVSGDSGIAEALQEVEGGDTVTVGSDEGAEEWALRMKEISEKSTEEREAHAIKLRESYRKVYSWRTECERFKRMIEEVVKSEGPLSPSVMFTTGFEKGLKELPKTVELQERNEGSSSPSVMPTTGFEKGLKEMPKTVEPQERYESFWSNKAMVSRSKISKEGRIQMVQNVPLRLTIPSKALPTPAQVTCSIWHPQILSPPLGRNEALVSSVIKLGCGSLSGTKKSYKFDEKVKLALSHSASDIKGYELVIKELINEKTNDWRDLETKWAWKTSDVKDEHSRLEEFPDWLFPFAEAEITSFSSFAVVWRLKSFTFQNISTLSSSFACILSDYPGVRVLFPVSSLPSGKNLSLTVKVQEVLRSDYKQKELPVAGPIIHISPSQPVHLLAPARLTIPVTLRGDKTKFPDYSAADVRILSRSSEEDKTEWNEITEQLVENLVVLESGRVTFAVNHFSEYWVWIDWMKLPVVILKNFAADLCRKLMIREAGFLAWLCNAGKPTNYLLTLCCFPLHLKGQVRTPLSPAHRVCAQGGGNSLKPLCKEDWLSVSLSEAFTVILKENLDNFLKFLGDEPFERSLPVFISDFSNLRVELYTIEKYQFKREALCTLYIIPAFPDQAGPKFSTTFPSLQAPEETDPSICSSEVLKVTILADEWNSLKGGLSTFNRELTIHLARHSQVQVTVLVPNSACGEEEKTVARKHGVTIVEAEPLRACSPQEELFFPPKDLGIDAVIGHGVKLGRQAQIIRKFRNCMWVQVVHTAPEELGMYKDYPKAVAQSEEKNQREVGLCEIADLVMAVGPKLKSFYSTHLRSFDKDQDVVEFTPGIMGDLTDLKQSPDENDKFQVLMFGRGDDEDFKLKGYDIAAEAFASHDLKNDSYHLTFVGAASGMQDEVAAKILKYGISKNQLSVNEYIKDRNVLKQMLRRIDLVIMPSRTEGFGLTALEALSAGLPVLAGHNSGFSKALQKVEFGELCVVNSDKPEDWSKAIKSVRQKEREKRLHEMQRLRASYGQKYNWQNNARFL